MRIYSTNINEQNLPSYDILLCLLKTLNPKEKESDIIKAIKKLNIYDVPTTTTKSTKGKAVDFANVGDIDNL